MTAWGKIKALNDFKWDYDPGRTTPTHRPLQRNSTPPQTHMGEHLLGPWKTEIKTEKKNTKMKKNSITFKRTVKNGVNQHTHTRLWAELQVRRGLGGSSRTRREARGWTPGRIDLQRATDSWVWSESFPPMRSGHESNKRSPPWKALSSGGAL